MYIILYNKVCVLTLKAITIVECCGLRFGIINIEIYEQRVPRVMALESGRVWCWIHGWVFFLYTLKSPGTFRDHSLTLSWARRWGEKTITGPPGGLRQRRRCLLNIVIIITKILLCILYDGKRAAVLIICIALFHDTKAARRRPWPPL